MRSSVAAALVAFVASKVVLAAPTIGSRAAQVDLQSCKPTFTGNLVYRGPDGQGQRLVVVENGTLRVPQMHALEAPSKRNVPKTPVIFSACTEKFLGYNSTDASVQYGNVAVVPLGREDGQIAIQARYGNSRESTPFILSGAPHAGAEDSGRLFDQWKITINNSTDATLQFVNGRKEDALPQFRYIVSANNREIVGNTAYEDGSSFALIDLAPIDEASQSAIE
ncbi:hypothetical protein IE81DRAFT_20965 [Ceraceosorus guamensis]|uniref:Alginate lyase 2 domain-containing protein n=1 Tax=Ceraceosorus guamensis TaxID=1522189 RepID=A0A316W9Z0_9BASI|nr:hypothetical protein IE81DRAFT_20965 [Ceraceosorus guamensis]PWN44465.1 hypothetical protein IE81DRAFT_20965 [Ceraceosorus guamensis]